MITKKEFTNLVETDRGSMISAIASLTLLAPGASWLYEESEDRDHLYKETVKLLTKKTNEELLEEAIVLGITE